MRPGVARLHVELPVHLGDMVGVQNPVLLLQSVALGERVANEGGVDRAVDDRMRDMDALRPELPRHALRQRPEREFRARKGAEARAPAKACRRAGKDDRALASRHHHARRLASGEEARIGRHLPDLAIDALGHLDNGEIHIGADIEDHDLDGPHLALHRREEVRHLVFLPRVRSEAARLAAFGSDLIEQGDKFFFRAPRHAGDISPLRESSGDGAAGRVARSDHDCRFPLAHSQSSGRGSGTALPPFMTYS